MHDARGGTGGGARDAGLQDEAGVADTEADAAAREWRRAAALRRRLAAQGVTVEPAAGRLRSSRRGTGGAATRSEVRPDPSAAPSTPPGIELIAPGLVARAIGGDLSGDLDETVEPTSREDEERLAVLRRYQRAPGGLFRRHLVADEATLARLAALAAEAPNGASVIAVVERAAMLSRHARSPLRLPPILIHGAPGTGKSRLARRLAEALGTTLTVVDGGSTTDRGPIVGHDIGYRGASPGAVARALLDGTTAGPMILLDEVDKVSAYNPAVRPLDALLPLLEPSTARAFTDTYIGLPMRAEGIGWILTANDPSPLPAPLLDRVIAIEMPRLGRAGTREAVQRLHAELLAEHGLAVALLDKDALVRLERQGLRQARRILALALGPALAAGRAAPDAGDVGRAAALMSSAGRPKPARKRASTRGPVGFVRFGT